MGQYAIREVEALSGIKAHTLRMWEQRYQFLIPERTDTNIRYYTDDQLRYILNISLLNRNGYKISRIAAMEPDQISDTILKITHGDTTPDILYDSLIRAMIDFDEARFEKAISAAILKMGFADTFTQLILPFLDRTGVLWSTGAVKPAQEHFISNLIKRKLMAAIDNQYINRDEKTRRFILFLPEGEWHELMLLFTDLLLRPQHDVLYLGCSVPLQDIDFAYASFRPDYIITYLTAPLWKYDIQALINSMAATYSAIKVLIGGPMLADNKLILPANVKKIDSAERLMASISE